MEITEKIEWYIVFHSTSDFEEDWAMWKEYCSVSDLFEVTTREYINRDWWNYKTKQDTYFKWSSVSNDWTGRKLYSWWLVPARCWNEGFALLKSHEEFYSLF